MLRWILGSSLQFRYLVLAIAVALMVFGVSRLPTMSIDVLPEFAPPFVEVQTEALGLAATEVEALITVPIEELLNGVPWLKSIRSQSITGLSSIILFFEPGTNLIRARQMVQERLIQAQGMPSKKVAKAPVMLQPRASASRVMMVGLSSSKLSLIDLSVLTRWNIKPRLMGIPGVANVSVWGQRERQLQVQVDPKRLQSKGITLDQIIATSGNSMWVSPLSFLQASTPGSGGFVDNQNQRLGITHLLPISTPKDLSQVIIEGTKLPLGSVTSIQENHQPLIGDAVVNDGSGLLLVVDKFPNANTLEVSRKVQAALEALAPGLTGVKIDTKLFQPASFLETVIANLSRTFLWAGLLAVVVLFAFVFNWRTALIGVVAIVASLLAAMFVLYLRGTPLNVMVFAGLMIALGAVIDDAVSDVGNFSRRLKQLRAQGNDKPTLNILLESSLRVRTSLAYATLIALLAALPVYALNGFTGALFQPLVLSYLLALLASMAVALTITPALCLTLFQNSVPVLTQAGITQIKPESPVTRVVERIYDSLIAPVAARQGASLVVFGIIALAGVLALTQLRPGALLPNFKETDLLLEFAGKPGASREAMLRIATDVSRELRAVPGVLNATAHIGRAVTSDEVVGISSGKLWVSLDPKADYDQTVAAVREKISLRPEFGKGVQTYLKKVTDDALVGAGNAVIVRVYGHELPILTQKAQEVKKVLEGVNGVVASQIVRQTEEPILEVKVKLEKAQRYGLKPGDVRRAATTLVNGIEVGSLFEAQKVFDVLVVGIPSISIDTKSIKALLIDTPDGGRVALSDVADIRLIPTPSVIRREGNSRWIDVEASVQGRDVGVVIAEVKERLKGINFPLEYHPEVLGEYTQIQAAQQNLLGFAIAAAIAIFLVLQAAVRGWRLAILTFATLMVALVGGVLALVITGNGFSFGVFAGFVALLGIAARGQIALIHHYQYLEQVEGLKFGPDLIRRGAIERLAPLVTTTLTTIAALLPFALSNGAGLEILRPLAAIMLGGLVTSSLINVLVLPALYLWLRETPQPEFDFASNGWLPNVRTADATD